MPDPLIKIARDGQKTSKPGSSDGEERACFCVMFYHCPFYFHFCNLLISVVCVSNEKCWGSPAIPFDV